MHGIARYYGSAGVSFHHFSKKEVAMRKFWEWVQENPQFPTSLTIDGEEYSSHTPCHNLIELNAAIFKLP